MSYCWTKEEAEARYGPMDSFRNRSWNHYYDCKNTSKIYGPRLYLNRKYSDKIIYGNDKVSFHHIKGPGYRKKYISKYNSVRKNYIKNGKYTTIQGVIGERIIECVDQKQDPVPYVTEWVKYRMENWIKPYILSQKRRKKNRKKQRKKQKKYGRHNELVNGQYIGYLSKRYVNIYLLYISIFIHHNILINNKYIFVVSSETKKTEKEVDDLIYDAIIRRYIKIDIMLDNKAKADANKKQMISK